MREIPGREYAEGAREGWESHRAQCRSDLERREEGDRAGGSILDRHRV